MLKGINKQIIEIRCTNDEVFEKALLFVRGDKADLPCDVIAEHSALLFGETPAGDTAPEKPKKRLYAAMAVLYTAAAVILGTLVYYGFQL